MARNRGHEYCGRTIDADTSPSGKAYIGIMPEQKKTHRWVRQGRYIKGSQGGIFAYKGDEV